MKGYQNVTIDGKDHGAVKRRKDSEFFNERKWENFIEPFLPEDCADMTFLEVGCNNGLFLKLAKNKGFRNVIGIDRDETVCNVAREYLGDDAEVIHAELDISIFKESFLDKILAADYVLLSNVHYYIFSTVFLHFLNIMRRRCRFMIIVSDEKSLSKLYRAKGPSDVVRRYFKDWEEVGYIDSSNIKKSVLPRRMYSVMFKSNVERKPLKDIVSCFGGYGRYFHRRVTKSIEKSKLNKISCTYPLLLRGNGSLLDGNHRLCSLELEGYKTALCEVINEKSKHSNTSS